MGAIADASALVLTKRMCHRGCHGDIPAADLLYWLSSIHVAQLEAGDAGDGDGWDFFAMLYQSLSGDGGWVNPASC